MRKKDIFIITIGSITGMILWIFLVIIPMVTSDNIKYDSECDLINDTQIDSSKISKNDTIYSNTRN